MLQKTLKHSILKILFFTTLFFYYCIIGKKNSKCQVGIGLRVFKRWSDDEYCEFLSFLPSLMTSSSGDVISASNFELCTLCSMTMWNYCKKGKSLPQLTSKLLLFIYASLPSLRIFSCQSFYDKSLSHVYIRLKFS